MAQFVMHIAPTNLDSASARSLWVRRLNRFGGINSIPPPDVTTQPQQANSLAVAAEIRHQEPSVFVVAH